MNEDAHEPRRAFRAGVVIGGGVLLFGVAGLIRNRAQTDPGSALRFIIGALIAHDALWGPLVAAVSVVLVRVVPRRVRPALMGTLAVSAVLALVAIPPLAGRGKLANNPSILPRDYGRGLLIALAATWAIGALLAIRAARRPPTADGPQPPPDPGRRATSS